MNLKNKMINIRIVFASLIVLFSTATIACEKNADIQNQNISTITEKDKILDSLEIDFNQDGKLDKVLVLERDETKNRIIKILLKTDKGFETVGVNSEIIDCGKCGYQSGDPYINIEKRQSGFDIMLENSVYSFIYSSNQFFLDKIDLLQTKQSSDGIEETHEVFTPNDFGVLTFTDIKNTLILNLLDKRSKLQSSNNVDSNKAESFILGKKPLRISLPFSFYEYFKSDYSTIKYPSYVPTSDLIEFLKSKDYEGETYKCFVIQSDEDSFYIVVSVLRGDSEYFVLVTTQKNKIIDYSEIGSIGSDNPITFKVTPQYIIEKYNGNGTDLSPTEILKIDNSGKIRKVR